MFTDIRIGTRMLLKHRGLTFAAVAVLAMGIAANTAVFTIANAIVLRDLPFQEADRIVEIRTLTRQGSWAASYPDVQDWRERSRTLEGICVFADGTVSVSDEERAAERFMGSYVSANTFALLGRQPLLGLTAGVGLQSLGTLLFGVTPFDGSTYAAVMALLCIVAGIASYVPARRATHVEPIVALRQE